MDGPEAQGAGKWTSTFPGKYLEGGKEAGGQLVDQRLLPRIDEGEVRMLMAGDTLPDGIHKKPMDGGLSAVGGNSDYTYYEPDDAEYADLETSSHEDIPKVMTRSACRASRCRCSGRATSSRRTRTDGTPA